MTEEGKIVTFDLTDECKDFGLKKAIVVVVQFGAGTCHHYVENNNKI